jgi:hypothetical protein
VQSGQLQLFMSFFFDELCVDYKNECSHLISNELGALRIAHWRISEFKEPFSR